jgi:hypothetical protein
LTPSDTPGSLGWRKSSFSAEGQCVELATTPSGEIALRNSNHPTAGTAVFTQDEFQAFLLGAKAGEFDDMA